MLFINQATPYLRIYNPATEGFAQFQGGKLQLEEGDDDYEVVMAEALRNPAIIVLADGIQCPECGEPFTGKAAKPQLGQHRKNVHFEKWIADQEGDAAERISVEVKRNQPLACDLCPRLQEFQTAEDLARHVQAVHTAVDLDDAGNPVGDGAGTDNAANDVAAEPPAAKASKAK
jgi:hypothetical protein